MDNNVYFVSNSIINCGCSPAFYKYITFQQYCFLECFRNKICQNEKSIAKKIINYYRNFIIKSIIISGFSYIDDKYLHLPTVLWTIELINEELVNDLNEDNVKTIEYLANRVKFTIKITADKQIEFLKLIYKNELLNIVTCMISSNCIRCSKFTHEKSFGHSICIKCENYFHIHMGKITTDKIEDTWFYTLRELKKVFDINKDNIHKLIRKYANNKTIYYLGYDVKKFHKRL